MTAYKNCNHSWLQLKKRPSNHVVEVIKKGKSADWMTSDSWYPSQIASKPVYKNGNDIITVIIKRDCNHYSHYKSCNQKGKKPIKSRHGGYKKRKSSDQWQLVSFNSYRKPIRRCQHSQYAACMPLHNLISSSFPLEGNVIVLDIFPFDYKPKFMVHQWLVLN